MNNLLYDYFFKDGFGHEHKITPLFEASPNIFTCNDDAGNTITVHRDSIITVNKFPETAKCNCNGGKREQSESNREE